MGSTIFWNTSDVSLGLVIAGCEAWTAHSIFALNYGKVLVKRSRRGFAIYGFQGERYNYCSWIRKTHTNLKNKCGKIMRQRKECERFLGDQIWQMFVLVEFVFKEMNTYNIYTWLLMFCHYLEWCPRRGKRGTAPLLDLGSTRCL